MQTSTTPTVTASAMLAHLDSREPSSYMPRPPAHRLLDSPGSDEDDGLPIAAARAALLSSIGHQIVDLVCALIAQGGRSNGPYVSIRWAMQTMRMCGSRPDGGAVIGLLVSAALAAADHPLPTIRAEYPTMVEPDLVMAWRAA